MIGFTEVLFEELIVGDVLDFRKQYKKFGICP